MMKIVKIILLSLAVTGASCVPVPFSVEVQPSASGGVQFKVEGGK